ncbi:hypothetical protein PN482_01095 [Microcystis aeruginosa CS-555/01A07]|uniref:hypothetical protein n=1 Tax=Microcystis aeruginosa TaxID=1126 RepID=UPI00232BE1E4|nr:hypothetical protein [Microcystis aeruginosa]MDB9427554.1 hypothetical protein [Microcystis aeruginosa CS-555/01A07]
MKLDQFEYISNRGEPNEWLIDGCQLGNINLIVGKNASGKSRIVKSIYKLSELLSGSDKIDQLFRKDTWLFRKDTWHLFFDRTTNCETEYFLELENGEVLQERLIIGSQQLLERNESGEGKIFAQELNQYMRFQTPKTELAVVKRRDTIQREHLTFVTPKSGFYVKLF